MVNNTFGIKAASLKYFNKTPDSISASQAAMLIGMLKATSTYNPIKNPEKCKIRRNTVLSQMEKNGYITKPEYDDDLNQELGLDLSYVEDDSQGDSYIRRAVEKWLDKWCKDNHYDLYEDGLKIYTTIDPKLQANMPRKQLRKK